jgi:hypothetical protein
LALGGLELQAAAVSWDPCHRIIASEYADENLFDRLGDAADLENLRALADLTNALVLDQMGQIELVQEKDRIYGHGSGLIMAAFAWPGKPSRFSDGSRGTYYAADAEETAIAETVYHDEIVLAGTAPIVLEKTLLHAALRATLVDIRSGCPAPANIYHATRYDSGQALGNLVRRLDGDGLIYDSMRRRTGECVAIFRPPVLTDARPVRALEYVWDGQHIIRAS